LLERIHDHSVDAGTFAVGTHRDRAMQFGAHPHEHTPRERLLRLVPEFRAPRQVVVDGFVERGL